VRNAAEASDVDTRSKHPAKLATSGQAHCATLVANLGYLRFMAKYDIQAFANVLIRTPLFLAVLLVPTTPNRFRNLQQSLVRDTTLQSCHPNTLG
jgi:hypothetical protein